MSAGYPCSPSGYFGLLSVTTGMVLRTFWTLYGRFTNPSAPVGKAGASEGRLRSQAPLFSLTSDPPSNLPQSLGRLETVPGPVCRPPVAPQKL